MTPDWYGPDTRWLALIDPGFCRRARVFFGRATDAELREWYVDLEIGSRWHPRDCVARAVRAEMRKRGITP